MSRKDYAAIAAAINGLDLPGVQLRALVRALVPVFKADNRAFSADKFATACGADADFGY